MLLSGGMGVSFRAFPGVITLFTVDCGAGRPAIAFQRTQRTKICTLRPKPQSHRASDPLHRHVPRTLHKGCSVLAWYSTFPCSSQSTQPAASVALVVVPSHLRPNL